jgi:hypothetical protein
MRGDASTLQSLDANTSDANVAPLFFVMLWVFHCGHPSLGLAHLSGMYWPFLLLTLLG